ncbi:MAG: peptidylprolyl isomerase [Thermoplasmata archaeon]
MSQAKNGDTVKVHYTGRLENGTVFDSSTDDEPLQFTIGEGQIIPGFEQAIIGMNVGESKTIKIHADEAYGPHLKDLVVMVDRKEIPPNLKPEAGQQLQIRQQNGATTVVTVIEVSESSVTIDANHPLAGKDLTFDVELIEVV